MGTILIRVDASNQIGMGHLTRCLDIANHASKKGVIPVFLTKTNSVKEIINNKEFDCILIAKNPKHAVKEMKNLISKFSSKVMLVDINYCTTIEQRHEYFDILKELKELDIFLLSFEDLSSEAFPADIVVIPYVGAESLKIQKKVGSQYLLGPKFFPVREEFRTIEKNKTPEEDVKTILVTMGGSDPTQITIKVVKALSKIKLKAHLIVVLGSLSKISDVQVKSLLSNFGGSFQVIKDAQNMAELMNESQLTITNSGLTKYEMAYMGLPAIIITNSKKYAPLMDDFASYGSAMHIGYSEDVTNENIINGVYELIDDRKKRQKMSELGKQLVDGHGIERIFKCIPGYLIYD